MLMRFMKYRNICKIFKWLGILCMPMITFAIWRFLTDNTLCWKEVIVTVVCITALCANISYILYKLIFQKCTFVLSERMKMFIFFLLGVWYTFLLCYEIATEYQIIDDYWYHQLKYIDNFYMYGGFMVLLSFSFALWKNENTIRE